MQLPEIPELPSIPQVPDVINLDEAIERMDSAVKDQQTRDSAAQAEPDEKPLQPASAFDFAMLPSIPELAATPSPAQVPDVTVPEHSTSFQSESVKITDTPAIFDTPIPELAANT